MSSGFWAWLVHLPLSLCPREGVFILAFDRPSMFLFFDVRSDKNTGDDVQSMIEKEILADSDISMTTTVEPLDVVASMS